MGKKKIYLPVKLAQSKEKIQQQQQQQRQRRRRQRVLLLLLCRLPCTHTHSGTHARWLRAPFHWQSVDVVSVGFGRVRAVTASKINARIILPTLPLLLLFLLLLWRALNPTHTLTHTHTHIQKYGKKYSLCCCHCLCRRRFDPNGGPTVRLPS